MLPFLIFYMGVSVIHLFITIIIDPETPSQDHLSDQSTFQKFLIKGIVMILSIGK